MSSTLPVDDSHVRPDGVSDETVSAVGKVTEALEWVERARGDLYELHQKIGHADETFAQAITELRVAGHHDLAERIEKEIHGRNVLEGRWTFQIVEEFNDVYYKPIVEVERDVREKLLDGKAHVYESELKEKTRTHGEPEHEARP